LTQPFFKFMILFHQIETFGIHADFSANWTGLKMLFVIKIGDWFIASWLVLTFKLELVKLSHYVFICMSKKKWATSTRAFFFLQPLYTFLAVKHWTTGSGTFEWLKHNTITNGAFIKFEESLQIPLICRHKQFGVQIIQCALTILCLQIFTL
jgi:hypothetical protein